MTTSIPANASSPANISPVGPPPAITTACSVIATLRPDTSTTTHAFCSPIFRRRWLATGDCAARQGACRKPQMRRILEVERGGERRFSCRPPRTATVLPASDRRHASASRTRTGSLKKASRSHGTRSASSRICCYHFISESMSCASIWPSPTDSPSSRALVVLRTYVRLPAKDVAPATSVPPVVRCLWRRDFVAHSWPKRRLDDWLNHAEQSRRRVSKPCK